MSDSDDDERRYVTPAMFRKMLPGEVSVPMTYGEYIGYRVRLELEAMGIFVAGPLVISGSMAAVRSVAPYDKLTTWAWTDEPFPEIACYARIPPAGIAVFLGGRRRSLRDG